VKQLVTADGTYATQSALVISTQSNGDGKCVDRRMLRRFLRNGDFFIAAALGTTLSKLVFRFQQISKDIIASGVAQLYIYYYSNVY
jgi:coatomer subunit beta